MDFLNDISWISNIGESINTDENIGNVNMEQFNMEEFFSKHLKEIFNMFILDEMINLVFISYNKNLKQMLLKEINK